MKKLILYIMVFIFKIILSLRYRVTVKGREHLTSDNLDKDGGVLFLPNHQAVLVDPAIVALAIFNKFPMGVNYLLYVLELLFSVINSKILLIK